MIYNLISFNIQEHSSSLDQKVMFKMILITNRTISSKASKTFNNEAPRYSEIAPPRADK